MVGCLTSITQGERAPLAHKEDCTERARVGLGAETKLILPEDL